MLDCIKKGVSKRISQRNKKLKGYIFSLTKKKNAINCFIRNGAYLDEYELAQELF